MNFCTLLANNNNNNNPILVGNAWSLKRKKKIDFAKVIFLLNKKKYMLNHVIDILYL
jgi:hypothetical protein